MRIYFDNAATTPMDHRVYLAMEPYLKEKFGNASSLHLFGLEAKSAIDDSQLTISNYLNCETGEVFFTSGATESNNLAIFGNLGGLKKLNVNLKPHIIISAIEHEAVLEPLKKLVKAGFDITFLKANSNGLIQISELEKSIKRNTALISIMYANNEIGTIQPIAEIGKLLSRLNIKRKNKIYFHTDATQAAPYLSMDVKKLGVDMLSFSGHKIYGPKGIGVLYLKKGTPYEPQFFGGQQQNSIRPGTFNTPGIVGIAKAVEIISNKKNLQSENERLLKLRNYLLSKIKAKIQRISFNGDIDKRIPSNLSVIFEGVEGESALLMLSQKGIAVSTGSACSTGSLEPSHVLCAIGIKPELAHGSIRFSFGRFNNKKEIDVLMKYLPDIISKLRKMSPLK